MNPNQNQNPNTHEKYENLKNLLKSYGSLAVAFSGGVDSTFLLKTARDVLGDNDSNSDGVIAVTARLRFVPERELNEAINFCEKEKITHLFCDIEELKIDGVAQNPPNRCYLCKNVILSKIKQTVEPYNIKYIADGTNFDDDINDRPGFKAITEHGVKSPLRDTGFTKSEIRELSKELGLPTWDKPSFACLASRFPYGEEITEKKLGMVDKAEQLLIDLGFTQFRVRIHGTIARIEVNPREFSKITAPEISGAICDGLNLYGFTHATLDLRGYNYKGSPKTIPKI